MGITKTFIGLEDVPVTSVNGKSGGDVTISAGDVGADPSGSAASVQGNLNTHTSAKSNPHSVTAAQVDAYSKSETDTKLGDKANKEDVPSNTETWTFSLEDGSTVEKKVYVG